MPLMIIPLFKQRSVAAANLRFFFFSARDAAKLPAFAGGFGNASLLLTFHGCLK
jgi:hypothetical protein